MKYPKINSYFKRDDKGVIIRDFDNLANPAFANIKLWSITEKIDGTNVRIQKETYTDIITQEITHNVTIGGRNHLEGSEKFGMPKPLMKYLHETFTPEIMNKVFEDAEVTLFGEGYGANINSGGKYRKDQSFILFDVVIHDENGHDWWMERDKVVEFADALGIDYVPYTAPFTFDEIETMINLKPLSSIAEESRFIEGYVCRTEPLLFDRRGKVLMFKIKVKDYEALAKNDN